MECLDTKYKEARLVNIIQSKDSNHPNMHLTNHTEAKAAEEFNQSEGSSTIKKGWHSTHRSKIRRVLIVQKG